MYKNVNVGKNMEEEAFKIMIYYNIKQLKREYMEYQKILCGTFREQLPLPILNRQKELELIFTKIEVLFYENKKEVADMLYDSIDVFQGGEQIYIALEKQISVLDFMQTVWCYEVQALLQELRVCFLYLQQHVNELEEFGGMNFSQKRC